MKTNTYTDVTRTQNTIYLRLKYDEPSGTVVNVRKSMWVHPTKDRAVSMGAESRGPRPEPAAAAVAASTASAGVFPAKVLGFRVCGLYLEWVSRTEADLGQLAPGGPA